MSIAEKLKECRALSNLTLDEVAQRIGTTRQNIYKYEHGIITNIPLDKLEMLAQLYGTTPAEITGWKSKKEDDRDELLEQLRQSPETRMLFDAAKGATAEQIKQAAEILKVLKGQK